MKLKFKYNGVNNLKQDVNKKEKMYIIGGFLIDDNSYTFANYFDYFNDETSTYSYDFAPIVTSSGAAIGIKNEFWSIVGQDGNDTLTSRGYFTNVDNSTPNHNKVIMFKNNSWATKPNFTYTMRGNRGCAVDDYGFSIGGSDGSPHNYNIKINIINDTYINKSGFPNSTEGTESNSLSENEFHSIGGTSERVCKLYSLLNDIWTTKTNINHDKKYQAQMKLNNKIYASGGNSVNSDKYNDEYDPINNVWTNKVNFSSYGPRLSASSQAKNKGFVFQGVNLESTARSKRTYKYNPDTNNWVQEIDYLNSRYTNTGSSIFDI